MKYIFTLSVCLLACSSNSQGQLLVGNNTNLTTGNTTIATNGSVVNQGSLIFGTGATLSLSGKGMLSSGNELVIPNLFMLGSDYVIDGTVDCLESLQLKIGTLSPEPDAQLILAEGASIVSENDAHINGRLYHLGSGEKFYPLGKNGNYTPVTLVGVTGDDNLLVGLEAFNQDLGITEFPADVLGASSNWYWEISASANFSGAKIVLPVTVADAGSIGAGGEATILQTDLNGSGVMDLGSDPGSDFLSITSELPALGPYVLLGFESDLKPLIHNIITPKNDDKNPFLIIDQIEVIAENEVILLDRWGNQVFREQNFTNYARNGNGSRPYDGAFDKLPSGNYICLLKYQGAVKKQVVTVLEE
ncbi:MAG: gliding motility-associated C-terminal domain-containing protein [Cyclobacteriaceae bacterium]